MENNKDMTKNLRENEPADANETKDNAQMVSLEDLMQDLPPLTDADTVPVRKTDTPDAEMQKPSEPVVEAETQVTTEVQKADSTKPTESESADKSECLADKWTSLFRKTSAGSPDTSETPSDGETPSSETQGVLAEPQVAEPDFADYAPPATEDAFAFVDESENPKPDVEKKAKKEKKKRERKSREPRYNKGEKRGVPEESIEPEAGIAFQNETGLPEEVLEEIPETELFTDPEPVASDASAAEPVPEKKKREKPIRESKPAKPAPEPGTPAYLCKMVLTLTVICVAIAALLAVVNAMTKDVIAENAEKKRSDAILTIFPEGDNVQTAPDKEALYYVFAGENPIGFCANVAPNGYGGAIQMMVGVNTDGTVRGVQIVEMSETSGVGSKAGAADFLAQFHEKSGVFAVGENVDGIAGATISSKAVTEGVNMALALAGFVTVDEAGRYVPVDPAAYPVISLTPVETEPVETDEIETEPIETETETTPPETETETTPPETETETETVPPETETETEPETIPDETRPPETTPPETRPPETTPPETTPPETTPPETETETEINTPETETETEPETETETETEPETETETETEPETETEIETEPETETETETETESESESETEKPSPSRPPVRR